MSENREQNLDETTYPGCEGPESRFIKLISYDGHTFVIKREHAFVSETIEAMMSGLEPRTEAETNEVTFTDLPSHVVKDLCRYFTYAAKYSDRTTEVPEFPMAPEAALELLLAAEFCEC